MRTEITDLDKTVLVVLKTNHKVFNPDSSMVNLREDLIKAVARYERCTPVDIEIPAERLAILDG